MAQDNNQGNTGEYEFKEDQDTSAEYKYEEEQPSRSSQPRKRPMAAVITIVITVFLVYEIGHLIFHSKKLGINKNSNTLAMQSFPTQQASILPPAEKMMPLNASPAKSTTPQPINLASANMSVSENTNMQDLADKITALQATNASLMSSLEKQQFQSQSSMMTLQENMTNLTQQLSQISQNMQVLISGYQAMQNQAKQKTLIAVQHQTALRQKKQYFVDAVIPGRAWVKAIDGTTKTITVGQSLPGYGKIIAIDPYSGVVKTSHGNIPYGTSAN